MVPSPPKALNFDDFLPPLTLLLFAGLTAWFGLYALAAAEGAAALVLFAVQRGFASRRRRELQRYVQSAIATLDTAFRAEMPLPMAVVSISNNEIYWANAPFNTLTGQSGQNASAFRRKLDAALPDFSTRWLAEGRAEYPGDYLLNGRRYRITGRQIHSPGHDPSLFLASICLSDTTELLNTRDQYIRSRPVVAILLIDNYDELVNKLPDSAVSTINAAIDETLTTWTESSNGILRKLERNRYLFLFEARDLERYTQERFSILETIRTVVNPSGIGATLSLGIGKDGASFAENYSFASLSIEMSLSRGGDQAVIKDKVNFVFYGGKAQETERRTKVKSRVIANSLSELIRQSGEVFVMGHKNADLDAVGAAAGVCCICRKAGKRARIVMDLERNAAKAILPRIQALPEYEGAFLSPDDAMVLADAKSLLVVVDTNRPDQVESKPLLESIPRVAVIDHHRRAADYIEQVVLNLHEPFCSSASELVTELLQYAVDAQDILPAEAQALLAGVVLDTKSFTVRTGSRTFEAAAFLRRAGADTVEVKKLFQNDLKQTVARYQIIQKARIYRGDIAIAALDYTSNRTTAAQAADELLNIAGVGSSFVLYPDGERIIISARSIGDTNVQVILEPLGGGGNAAAAGAQVPAPDVQSVLKRLVASIDQYFEE